MNIQDLSALCYIQEQTSFEEDYKKFGYNVVPSLGGKFYVVFDAVLQSFGIKNRNGREYDATNIMECINTDTYIQEQLAHNSWMGEVDHPAAEHEGEKLTMNRIANPDPKLASHFIRSPRLNGNLLEAKIQTDTGTDAGMNFAYKIVDGKIYPCFSARVLGALRNIAGRAIVYVNKLICYDWVLFPSHPEAVAKISQPVMESVRQLEQYSGAKIIFLKELAQMAANNSKETEFLCESFGLTIDDVVGITHTGNSIVIQEGANMYMQPITDKTIRTKTQNDVRSWLNN